VGYETRCLARVRDAGGATREGEGAVLLETDELIVRGPARVRVPRASITDVRADGGALTVTHAAGTVTLVLGADAAKWRDRIAEPPKARIDKLDVKSGARVWVVNVDDGAFADEVRARTPNVRVGGRAAESDVVFLGVERDADLARVAKAAAALAPRGALWVVHPKGPGGVPDTAVFAAGKAAGLTAVKVARWSATHTAEKLVRPLRATS
jgi:hypothetical protein